ncbi:putative xanthosine triphosphate pyrophosphatase [Pedobacter sp. BAL39]|uniref:RdgB/HAM1 family non-canonical purine NTP pyrophosphatase n=1 Tax=Pedobacter sp. BAL39 TaxID=391596 RepID=UPI000155B071|nr:RdgB/HAM1 family non-canonical purine NTP pyrophosphatase [Pedobacter sp. BAL39]EDM34384.1 putative xanthosine triphosphate pyrophosphatase [Pedobacter sp. BAL39]
MRSLVFATNNQYKTAEVNKLLEGKYEVLNLSDIGCETDIPETGSSFAENANLKSHYVAANYQMDCFADDSGLEVEALNNEPGIFSARYSGVRDDRTNLLFLLDRLKGQVNRAARFKTVISLVQGGNTFLFEGVIEGTIREVPVGDQGFGYDPIFEPQGYEQTFAEMSMAQKNEISHRAIAMRKLIAFLKEQV